MRFKILGLIAVVGLLAACETAPEESAAASGAGDQSSQAASQSASQEASRGGGQAALAEPTPGSQEDLVVNVGDRVHFEYDKYVLLPGARATLEKQAAWLNKYPSVSITVEGHCDERGTREYNLALGERRANSVKDYLMALGISSGRIKTLSYGKERPVALGSNSAAWAQNRRAVTTVGSAGS